MSTQSSEFLLTSCKAAQPWSACLWDFNSESGNALQTYKGGGVAASNTLSQIGNDFILTAEQSKPLLHLWPVNSQEQVKNVRLVLPEVATVLAVSTDNSYLAAGVASKLYIWNLCSGKLLSVQQKHLLPITCVKFSRNDDYLLTSCQSGTLLAYNFGSLVCFHNSQLAQSEIGQVEPMYSRRDHSGAITDLHVGMFGLKSRFATVSNDHTCWMYDLLTGQPLLQLIYNEQLTAVTFDSACWNLFLGGNSGTIRQFSLQNPPRKLSMHIEDKCNKLIFAGHKSRISCLDLNVLNEILVSGSDDLYVIVWDIQSGQMLNKLEHKGAITNARFVMHHKNWFGQTFKPQCVVKTLERSIELDHHKFVISRVQKDDIVFSNDDEDDSEKDCGKVTELQRDLLKAKGINKQLYETLLELSEKYNRIK